MDFGIKKLKSWFFDYHNCKEKKNKGLVAKNKKLRA